MLWHGIEDLQKLFQQNYNDFVFLWLADNIDRVRDVRGTSQENVCLRIKRMEEKCYHPPSIFWAVGELNHVTLPG